MTRENFEMQWSRTQCNGKGCSDLGESKTYHSSPCLDKEMQETLLQNVEQLCPCHLQREKVLLKTFQTRAQENCNKCHEKYTQVAGRGLHALLWRQKEIERGIEMQICILTVSHVERKR